MEDAERISGGREDKPRGLSWRRRSVALAMLAAVAAAAVAHTVVHHNSAGTVRHHDASSTASAVGYLRCQAAVDRGLLVAPFWLDSGHFDRPTSRPVHTAQQVRQRYRDDEILDGLRSKYVTVAFAAYSNLETAAHAAPVWMVVSYGISKVPPMITTSFHTDQIVIYDDKDLANRGILGTLPTRCR